MHALRSRVGVVSITAGAAVLLALPVVAAGQVPGVDQVVGGVTQTAESIAPLPVAPALPAPPAQAPAAKPPAAAPAPAAPGPAASAPAAPRQSATGGARQPASSSGRAAASSAPKSASAAGGHTGARERQESDAPVRASQDDSAGESAGSDAATVAADLPDDASADTLPFTGLQLALILMSGLAALAGGLVLRRSARSVQR
jgi:hypothetical protein